MTVPPLSGAACQEVSRSGPASTCEPYRFIIEEKLSRGLYLALFFVAGGEAIARPFVRISPFLPAVNFTH